MLTTCLFFYIITGCQGYEFSQRVLSYLVGYTAEDRFLVMYDTSINFRRATAPSLAYIPYITAHRSYSPFTSHHVTARLVHWHWAYLNAK